MQWNSSPPWRAAAPLIALALAAAWTLAARAPAAAQASADRLAVEVPVLVLDKKGQPMLQLDKDLFRLTDDGAPQRLTAFDNDARPVSLAVVVDTYDRDAISQAKRSAELLVAMVEGAAGEASVYLPGPQAQQAVAFTGDHDRVVDGLRHLVPSPQAPLGAGQLTAPVNLAARDLASRPAGNTRVILLIASSSDRSGGGAAALVQTAMTGTISIFRIAPNQPPGAGDYENPVGVEAGGGGQGSQREAAPPDAQDRDRGAGTVNLGPIVGAAVDATGKAARAVVLPHDLDYIYDSGGLTLSASTDAEFDQKLALIGSYVRSLYHLYYQPNNLGKQAARHSIDISMRAAVEGGPRGSAYYRHSWFGGLN